MFGFKTLDECRVPLQIPYYVLFASNDVTIPANSCEYVDTGAEPRNIPYGKALHVRGIISPTLAPSGVITTVDDNNINVNPCDAETGGSDMSSEHRHMKRIRVYVQPKQLLEAETFSIPSGKEHAIAIRITNHSETPVTIYKGTGVARAYLE